MGAASGDPRRGVRHRGHLIAAATSRRCTVAWTSKEPRTSRPRHSGLHCPRRPRMSLPGGAPADVGPPLVRSSSARWGAFTMTSPAAGSAGSCRGSAAGPGVESRTRCCPRCARAASDREPAGRVRRSGGTRPCDGRWWRECRTSLRRRGEVQARMSPACLERDVVSLAKCARPWRPLPDAASSRSTCCC